MKLAGKVVIVTGSTTGIGEATARRVVAEGGRVLIHGRDQQRGEAVADELGEAAALHIDDLADAEAPQRLVDAALRAFGKIDGIVNNAAAVVRSTLASTDAESFDRIMRINVRAPLLLTQAALDSLKQTQGSIVNIGSINAYTGQPFLLDYSVSKGALMTLSRYLANVLGADHVRVTHLNVGWVLTPNEYRYKIEDGLPEGWPDSVPAEFAPVGRMTQPEEIAEHAVFWLSDASRPVSGSVVELEQYPIIGRLGVEEVD